MFFHHGPRWFVLTLSITVVFVLSQIRHELSEMSGFSKLGPPGGLSRSAQVARNPGCSNETTAGISSDAEKLASMNSVSDPDLSGAASAFNRTSGSTSALVNSSSATVDASTKGNNDTEQTSSASNRTSASVPESSSTTDDSDGPQVKFLGLSNESTVDITSDSEKPENIDSSLSPTLDPASNLTLTTATAPTPSLTAEPTPAPTAVPTPSPTSAPTPALSPGKSSSATVNDYEPGEPVLVDAPLEGYDETKLIYSLARSDRSGEVIRNMMLAHAYSFENDLTYAGACPLRRTHHNEPMVESRILDTRRLLRDLGLDEALPFRCPPGISTSRSAGPEHRVPYTYEMKDSFPTHLGLLPYDEYPRSGLLSDEYRAYLRSQMKISTTPSSDDYIIVAHLRRGDINPCREAAIFAERYLPNAYYLHMIDMFKQEHLKRHAGAIVHVIIYSERRPAPFESFDDFTKLGYAVELDTPLNRVWKSIAIESNVAILSKSSFSYVPALLADTKRTTVAYFPYNVGPKKGWRIATGEEKAIADKGRRELQKRCPRE